MSRTSTEPQGNDDLRDRAARFMVDVLLNWTAYACVSCGDRMAEPKSLLCDPCGRSS